MGLRLQSEIILNPGTPKDEGRCEKDVRFLRCAAKLNFDFSAWDRNLKPSGRAKGFGVRG